MSNTTATNATTAPGTPQELPVSPRAAYLAQVHVGVTVPLLLLTTVVFGTRMYARVWPRWRVEVCEWFMVVGYACTVASYGMLLPGIILTPRMVSLPEAVNAIMLSILAIPIFGLAMIVIKISAALSLLRVKNSPPWKAGLYIIIGLMAGWEIGGFIGFFQLCRPLSDWWDITNPTPNCVDASTIRGLSMAGSVIGITTDVLLSLSPITFLWTMHRPVRERVLLCLLMGMGLFASVASIMKMVIILRWSPKHGDDMWALSVSISTWTVTELFFGIMAGCLPFLKPLFERCLGRLGISVGQHQEEELYTDGPRGRNFAVKPVILSFSEKQTYGRPENPELSIIKTSSEGGELNESNSSV